jgi:hypothetical protein
MFPDSISLGCASEALGGVAFCNHNRTAVILDENLNEIDLMTSSLFELDSITGILKM